MPAQKTAVSAHIIDPNNMNTKVRFIMTRNEGLEELIAGQEKIVANRLRMWEGEYAKLKRAKKIDSLLLAVGAPLGYLATRLLSSSKREKGFQEWIAEIAKKDVVLQIYIPLLKENYRTLEKLTKENN